MSDSKAVAWRFSARSREGKTMVGTVHAATEAEALDIVKARHAIPLTVQRVRPARPSRWGRRVNPQALTVFTRQFATLIDAALPLLHAIEILSELSQDPTLRRTLKAVTADVNGGASLSDAIGNHPRVFPPLYVHMVQAGEVGGTLPQSLERTADYMEASQVLRDRIAGALIYPVVVLLTAVLAVAAILTFVVPVFADLFAAEGMILPVGTRILIGASGLTGQYWHVALLSVATAVVVARQLLSMPGIRAGVDRVVNRLPVIGNLALKAAVARMTRAMASMIHSGVTLSDSLLASARIAGNSEVEAAVMEVRTAIHGGSDLATPMLRAAILPELLGQMVKVGEESGRLEEMLDKVADFFEMEVNTAIEALMKALEPALIVVLAVLLGGIIVTMYTPIFDLMTSLG